MLNKDKVNEIVADMQEEERLRNEELERQTDNFLTGRLEYYVAMVINNDIRNYSKLKHALLNDINAEDKYDILNRAVPKILESLASFNIYMFVCNFGLDLLLREKVDKDKWSDIVESFYPKNSVINEYIQQEYNQRNEEYEREKVKAQNSLECDDLYVVKRWSSIERIVWQQAVDSYKHALKMGIAKEQARALLPEGLTPSRLYMNGNMRSWIFYLKQRLDMSTQKEHRIIAMQCLEKLREVAPVTMDAFFPHNSTKEV